MTEEEEFVEWLSNLSPERKELLYIRMAKRVEDDLTTFPEFEDIMMVVLKEAFVQDTLDNLVRKNVVEAEVGEDGELHYFITELGERLLDEDLQSD